MRLTRRLTGVAAGLSLALGVGVAAAPAATATTAAPLGSTSLASVLLADGNRFDHNSHDYDIVTEAVLAVLAAKPSSPVGVLTDGSVALTAFIPSDRAFRLLVKDLTGHYVLSEKKVFAAVAGLGIDTVEAVLLYHVVPGATITKRAALQANGVKLTTALGSTVTVRVPFKHVPLVILRDQDPDDRNPVVVRFNLNRGNRQIAHGIDRVLRPLDL